MYSTRSSKYYCIAKLCLQHTTYALLIATDRKIISNIKIASDRLVDYSTITPFFFCPGACLNFKTKLKRVLFFYFLPFKNIPHMVCGFLQKNRKEKKTQVGPYRSISFYSNIPPLLTSFPQHGHLLDQSYIILQ